MGTAVLTDQQKTYIHQYCVDTGCRLKDLQTMMANRDVLLETVKEICDRYAFMMMMIPVFFIQGKRGSILRATEIKRRCGESVYQKLNQ